MSKLQTSNFKHQNKSQIPTSKLGIWKLGFGACLEVGILKFEVKYFSFGICTLLLFCHLCFGLCHFSFAQEQADTQAAGEQTKPKQPAIEIPVNSLIWIEDSLPEGATTSDEWIWVKDIKFSSESSHTDGIKKGLHFHSFKATMPVKLGNDSVIEQYVYLDPANPPKGIMLKLIPSEGKEIDLYWEAEEEVFIDTIEYVEAWYMGFLPEAGCWQKLVINMEELEIAPFELAGISFITYDGRTWWDETSLANPSSPTG